MIPRRPGKPAPPIAPYRTTPRVIRQAFADFIDGPLGLERDIGFWLVRLVPGGPSTPARVYQVRTAPGEPHPLIDDEIETPVETWADIAGRPCEPEEIWNRRGTPIGRAEYLAMMAEISENRKNMRYDARLRPWEPIDTARLRPPDFKGFEP